MEFPLPWTGQRSIIVALIITSSVASQRRSNSAGESGYMVALASNDWLKQGHQPLYRGLVLCKRISLTTACFNELGRCTSYGCGDLRCDSIYITPSTMLWMVRVWRSRGPLEG
jgi:hypothetical protein